MFSKVEFTSDPKYGDGGNNVSLFKSSSGDGYGLEGPASGYGYGQGCGWGYLDNRCHGDTRSPLVSGCGTLGENGFDH